MNLDKIHPAWQYLEKFLENGWSILLADLSIATGPLVQPQLQYELKNCLLRKHQFPR